MRIIKSIFTCFTIWVLTALLNALLSGTWLSIFSNETGHWPEAFFIILISTLIFSIPGAFVLWIVLLINWNARLLFRTLLGTALVVSVLSSGLLYILPVDIIKGKQFFLSTCMVISSVASIMIHHTNIKSINLLQKLNNV